MKKLTPRQSRFVEEYAVDRNGAQAAIRAGYSQKAAKEVACRLLTYANVAAAVEKGAEEAAVKLKLDREAVLQGLLEAVEAAQTTTELVIAWREIARLLDLYPQKRMRVEAQVTLDDDTSEMRIRQLSDADLLDMLAEKDAELIKALGTEC